MASNSSKLVLAGAKCPAASSEVKKKSAELIRHTRAIQQGSLPAHHKTIQPPKPPPYADAVKSQFSSPSFVAEMWPSRSQQIDCQSKKTLAQTAKQYGPTSAKPRLSSIPSYGEATSKSSSPVDPNTTQQSLRGRAKNKITLKEWHSMSDSSKTISKGVQANPAIPTAQNKTSPPDYDTHMRIQVRNQLSPNVRSALPKPLPPPPYSAKLKGLSNWNRNSHDIMQAVPFHANQRKSYSSNSSRHERKLSSRSCEYSDNSIESYTSDDTFGSDSGSESVSGISNKDNYLGKHLYPELEWHKSRTQYKQNEAKVKKRMAKQVRNQSKTDLAMDSILVSDRQRDLMRNNQQEAKNLVIDAAMKLFAQYSEEKYKNSSRVIDNDSDLKKELVFINLLDNANNHVLGKVASEYLINEFKISSSQVMKDFKAMITDCLNRREWKTLTADIPDLKDSRKYFTNRLTPAVEMEVFGNKSLLNYPAGINGYSSRSNPTETEHASNLWKTELISSNGDILYAGLRHAVLTNRDPNKINRHLAAFNKTEEVFKSALMMKHGEAINKALEQKKSLDEWYNAEKKKGESWYTTIVNALRVFKAESNSLENEYQKRLRAILPEALELKLSSTSLMTRRNIRIGSLVDEPENSLSKEQEKAIQEYVANRPFIEIDGFRIPVKCEAISFMASMNDVAMGMIGKNMLNHDWSETDAVNKSSLETLVGDLHSNKPGGWVKEYLEKNGQQISDQKREKVLQIAADLKTIFIQKLHHSPYPELCKFSKRIAALSHFIGVVPAFNCKSGKDRTSCSDGEIKGYMAADCPSLREELEDGYINPYKSLFYFDGLNYALQELNTGFGGNKCANSKLDYYRKTFAPQSPYWKYAMLAYAYNKLI